jgi:thiol:disulfide interchange protein DsbG
MQRRHFVVTAAAAAAALLAACSRKDETDSAPAAEPSALSPEEGLSAAMNQARGFAVGLDQGPTAYVFFDPQCPHCGHLWQATKPLLNKVRMVWIPVAFINPQSKPQGALLITAADPLATMSEHETSLLAGQGGLAIPERTAADLAAAIDTNTDLLGRMGADSVPFMLSRNAEGMVQTHAGAMETAALAAWLGVQP